MKILKQNRDALGVSRRADRATQRSAPSRQMLVQPKLELTTPGDSYEREADRMADYVMRKPFGVSSISMPSTVVANQPKILRRATGSYSDIAVDSATESGIHASRGGQPLPSALRSRMESGFGTDFSGVRLHTGSASETMSSDLNAKAFTYGNDIYFNRGQYSPDTTAGQHLIAHELTHVVQQSGKVGRDLINEKDKPLINKDEKENENFDFNRILSASELINMTSRIDRANYLFAENANKALDKKRLFKNKLEAQENMSNISVDIYTVNGKDSVKFKVHKKLSIMTKDIFDEIYNYYSNNYANDNFRIIKGDGFGGYNWRYSRSDIQGNIEMIALYKNDINNLLMSIELEKSIQENNDSSKKKKKSTKNNIARYKRNITKITKAIEDLERRNRSALEKDNKTKENIQNLRLQIKNVEDEISGLNREIDEVNEFINSITNVSVDSQTLQKELYELESQPLSIFLAQEQKKIQDKIELQNIIIQEKENKLNAINKFNEYFNTEELRLKRKEEIEELLRKKIDYKLIKRLKNRLNTRKEKSGDRDRFEEMQKLLESKNKAQFELDLLTSDISSIHQMLIKDRIRKDYLETKKKTINANNKQQAIDELKQKINYQQNLESTINKGVSELGEKKYRDSLVKNVKINQKIKERKSKEIDKIRIQIEKEEKKISSFVCSRFSEHAAGVAIDINPRYNKFYEKGIDMPNEFENTDKDMFVMKKSSQIVKIFEKYGWKWGGDWSTRDYMHFEWFSKTFPRS